MRVWTGLRSFNRLLLLLPSLLSLPQKRRVVGYRDLLALCSRKDAGRSTFRSLLRRDTSSIRDSRDGSDVFINELQKKSLPEVQFDLLKTQIESSNASWLVAFIAHNGGGLLLSHLTEQNYQ